MRYAFSDFVLDTDRLTLERAGARQAFRPMVLDLLIFLVESRHRVVRREELTASLWKGMRVGPGSLSGLVNELRRGLGEGRGAPSSIRTVHARGYQFIAEVVVEEGPTHTLDRLPTSAMRGDGAERGIVREILRSLGVDGVDDAVVDALIGLRRDEVSAEAASIGTSNSVPRHGKAPNRTMRMARPRSSSGSDDRLMRDARPRS